MLKSKSPNQAVFTDIDLDKYNAIVQKLHADKDASGLTVDQTMGKVSYQKIEFAWVYEPDAEQLTLTILSNHNFRAKLVGTSTVFDMIQSKLLA